MRTRIVLARVAALPHVHDVKIDAGGGGSRDRAAPCVTREPWHAYRAPIISRAQSMARNGRARKRTSRGPPAFPRGWPSSGEARVAGESTTRGTYTTYTHLPDHSASAKPLHPHDPTRRARNTRALPDTYFFSNAARASKRNDCREAIQPAETRSFFLRIPFLADVIECTLESRRYFEKRVQ